MRSLQFGEEDVKAALLQELCELEEMLAKRLAAVTAAPCLPAETVPKHACHTHEVPEAPVKPLKPEHVLEVEIEEHVSSKEPEVPLEAVPALRNADGRERQNLSICEHMQLDACFNLMHVYMHACVDLHRSMHPAT